MKSKGVVNKRVDAIINLVRKKSLSMNEIKKILGVTNRQISTAIHSTYMDKRVVCRNGIYVINGNKAEKSNEAKDFMFNFLYPKR